MVRLCVSGDDEQRKKEAASLTPRKRKKEKVGPDEGVESHSFLWKRNKSESQKGGESDLH